MNIKFNPKSFGNYDKKKCDNDYHHKVDCDRDFDQTLPSYIRLATAYTPYQRYRKECLFSPAEGFTKGTIFRGLYRHPQDFEMKEN